MDETEEQPAAAAGAEISDDQLEGLKDWTPPALLLEATARDGSTDRTLDDVLSAVRSCAGNWGLTILKPFDGLTYNFVAPAVSASHGRAVLKIGFGTRKFERESLALRLFDGQGAVRVLEWDHSLRAMLLEQADPGQPMVLDWDAHTEAFAALVKDMWRPAPEGTDLPLVSREVRARLRDLEAMRLIVSEGPFADRVAIVEKAKEVISELATSSEEAFVVHGDLHPYNVLSSNRTPWLSIDPLGCIGERAFDVCAILRDDSWALQEAADPQDMVDRRIRDLSAECGLDPQRVRAWSFVEAVRTQGWRYRTGKPLEEWSSLIPLVTP